MPFSKIKDPISPDKLALLQAVFDKLCAEHRIARDGKDAEALALILVRQLQNGKRDAATLEIVGSSIIRANELVP